MSLSVDGVWKAGVWATTVWADGVWREGAPTPAAVTPTGGHYWPKRRGRLVEPDEWRERTRAQRREFIERLISGANEAPQPVVEAAKAAVAAYESPRAPDDRLMVRKAAMDRLARDLAAVERLARAVQDYADEQDDEAIILLLSG